MGRETDATRGALFSFSAWLLPLAMTIAVTPVVVRALGPEHYGIYALVLGITASVIGLLSPTRTFTRHIAMQRRSRRKGTGGLLAAATVAVAVIGVGCSLVIAIGAGPMTSAVLRIDAEQSEIARRALLVAALGIPLGMAGHTLRAAAQGLRRFDVDSRVALGAAAALVGGNGVLAAAGFGLLVLIGWSVVMAGVSCAAHLYIASSLLPRMSLPRRSQFASLKPHIAFSVGLLASQVPGHLLLLFERVWVVRTLGTPAFTFYAIPMMVGLSLHAGLASMSVVFLPVASEAYSRDDRPRLRDIYTRALKLSAALVAPAAITLVATGPSFLLVWLGPEFAERSSLVLSMHAAAFGVLALVVVPWHLAEALGRPRWNVELAILWLITDGVLLVLLVPRFGINGAAAARLASMVVVPFYEARIERHVFGGLLGAFWGRVVAILSLAALVSGLLQRGFLAAAPAGWWSLGLAAALGAAGFVGTLWTLRYFSPAERAWLRSRAAKLLER